MLAAFPIAHHASVLILTKREATGWTTSLYSPSIRILPVREWIWVVDFVRFYSTTYRAIQLTTLPAGFGKSYQSYNKETCPQYTVYKKKKALRGAAVWYTYCTAVAW